MLAPGGPCTNLVACVDVAAMGKETGKGSWQCLSSRLPICVSGLSIVLLYPATDGMILSII
jgi:hypothetical protein